MVPDPVLVERTGTLAVGDLEIEVYNGTPGLEGLITWSFAQFRAQGLGTPKVRRVTFHDNQVDKCEGVAGLILGDVVTLCFDSAAACLDQGCTTWQTWAKEIALHELAHAWMDEHLTPEAIEQFQTATGMPTWSGRGARMGRPRRRARRRDHRLGHDRPARPRQPQTRTPHLRRTRPVLRDPHRPPTRTHPTRLPVTGGP